MTSRTPIGVHPRPPQRALSSSTLSVQRPSHQQRALSQQFFPPSPVRKDSFGDFSAEPVDPVQARHATTPRRGGSRLRLELSNHDLTSGPMSATSSPQGLTPSRMMPMSDAMDGGNTSPALSRASQLDADNPPMPMPKRRPPISQTLSTPATRVAAPAPAPTAAPAKKDARPKPWTVEVPTDAPRYPSTDRHDAAIRDPFSRGLFSGYADFFPWNGNHYEDDWSAEAIQKGTWDKNNPNLNETGTARLAISPAIKQKSGLNALSTIFMGVLNQRRHRGQITAPSTFKPPPRVTLTDTKREVWLKDLANPAISLRRLSRTIPHGIRGRTLLDQCLNKNVPTERAVWLAKCVGANEIRAFKRKGVNGAFAMGGELKWIRDWTVFVVQFVEAVVSAFGEPDWKAKVTYAIRLATNLYSEQLLDRDHYLDWIMAGLEHSPQSRIPMWILIAQICWADLLRSRKYGRRLVYALLNHLNTIHNDPDKDILIQLSSQLSTLINSLVKNHPDSFVCPSIWPKYREALDAFLPTNDKVARDAYKGVSLRNARLSVANTASSLAGRQHLVRLLDSTLQGQVDLGLSTKCWATSDDKIQIVKTTVEWATSSYRPGVAKVYVAANLIRAWSALRIDATPVILEHMDHIPPEDEVRKHMAYQLVTELVRTGHFYVGQYIRWLIARGNGHDASEVDSETAPCATRLLVNLPLYCLTEDQKRDRGNFLRRAANYSMAEEAEDIKNALKCVDFALALSPHPDDAMANRKPLPLRKLVRKIMNSNKALRSCVGAHIRDTLTQQPPNKSGLVISSAMFTTIRAILETAQDFSMLSEVLKACCLTTNIDVLASCVDTVNLNLQVFFTLGAADDLFNRFLARLKAISQERGLVARPLLAALCCLAQRMPRRGEILKQLTQELAQSDRNSAIDACSPVSDTMVNQAQSADGEVAEQIDKLLASGNSIDHPTMNRLFRYIVPRLEVCWGKMDDSRRVYASLLTRLRLFDSQHFDKLMADWVGHVRLLKERPRLAGLFPLLVITDCLPISALLQTSSFLPPPSSVAANDLASKSPGSATYLQELLQLILTKLPLETDLSPEEGYRFNIYQQSARSDHHKGLLFLIRNAAIEYAGLRGHSDTSELPLDDQSCRESILESLRLLVVTNSAEVTEAFNAKNMPPEGARLIHGIISSLLMPEGGCDSSASFDQILGLANELTMPFCQIKLNMELSVARPRLADGEEQGSSPFDLFAQAMDRAIEAHNIMWTSMLPCLSEDISQHLKSQARTRFLDLMPSLKSPNLDDAATNGNNVRLAENLLAVVEAIISGQPPPKSAQLNGTLVDKLSDLVELIAAKDQDKAKAQEVAVDHWLPTLLRFITLHNISSEPANTSMMSSSIQGKAAIPTHHEARARIILTLCRLLLELSALPHKSAGDMSQQVFDMAVLLVDGLPDDLRVHCAKSILLLPGTMPSMNTSSDSRLYYILSTSQPTAADNLMLAHREKSSMPHSAAVRGMGAMYGIGPASQEKLSPFVLRRWEVLSEPTPNVGENDTSLSLGLFEAIKIQ